MLSFSVPDTDGSSNNLSIKMPSGIVVVANVGKAGEWIMVVSGCQHREAGLVEQPWAAP